MIARIRLCALNLIDRNTNEEVQFTNQRPKTQCIISSSNNKLNKNSLVIKIAEMIIVSTVLLIGLLNDVLDCLQVLSFTAELLDCAKSDVLRDNVMALLIKLQAS